MTSWRDGLSQDALADLDRLLDSSLAIARDHLAKASEFDPFAIVVDAAGRTLAADWDVAPLGQHPEVELVIDAALVSLRELAPSARATALTINSRLALEKTDAIEVRLEHREGSARVVLLPYRRATFGPHIDFGELRAFPGMQDIWR